jgi:hypothetical protein
MAKINKTVKKMEMWRRYKGTTAEEMCAAIREIWLAKYPDYIRMLDEVPNKLIEQVAALHPVYDSDATTPVDQLRMELGAPPLNRTALARMELKALEKFLTTPPFADHFCTDLLEDEISLKEPDAPVSEYVEADKKKEALVKKFAITQPKKSM